MRAAAWLQAESGRTQEVGEPAQAFSQGLAIALAALFTVQNTADPLLPIAWLIKTILPAFAALGVIAAILAAFRTTGNRTEKGLYLTLTLLNALGAMATHLFFAYTEARAVLHDTWFATAFAHTFGVTLLFTGLTLLYAVQSHRTRFAPYSRLPLVTTILLGVSLFVLARIWLTVTGSLGISGMPRAYADHNSAYTESHQIAAIAAFGLLTLLLMALIRIIRLKPQKDRTADVF